MFSGANTAIGKPAGVSFLRIRYSDPIIFLLSGTAFAGDHPPIIDASFFDPPLGLGLMGIGVVNLVGT